MLTDRLLQKLGVTSFSELNAEERETLRKWETALNGRKLTDEDVSAFFKAEMADVLRKLPRQRYGAREDLFLKMKLEFLQKVQAFLDLPKQEKAMTEAAITSML